MARQLDPARDLAFLDVTVQQQVQDLLYFVQQQQHRQTLPRVASVRASKINCGSTYGAALQLRVIKDNPQSYGGTVEHVDIAVRIHPDFPTQPPMVACIAGAEKLPRLLARDGQLRVPWLQDGWPTGYSLSSFANDFCTALGNAATEHAPVYPLYSESGQDVCSLQPSAPTYYTSPSSDFRANSHIPRQTVFKCKWKDLTCQFAIPAPPSVRDFLGVLHTQFQNFPRTPVTLKAICSPTQTVMISSDKDLHLVCASNSPIIYILVEEQPHPQLPSPPPSSPIRSRDAPNEVLPSPQVQTSTPQCVPSRAILPPDCRPRELKWSEMQMQKCVGVGSSCRVYKGTWRGTEIAAKKFTGLDRVAVEREFANEVQMMQHLGGHPNLVLLVGVSYEPLAIVFDELINGVSDPNRRVPPFPTSWTKRVSMMLDIARGLQFLHSFDIIHRDLKSLNLLMTAEGRVKLADFGISRIAKQADVMTGCCGTFQWMAPEVITSQKYSLSADIYSFGVIIWEICEAAAPFADLPPATIPIAVVTEKKRPPISVRTPQPLRDLIQLCWQEEPVQRPTAAKVVEILAGFFPKE